MHKAPFTLPLRLAAVLLLAASAGCSPLPLSRPGDAAATAASEDGAELGCGPRPQAALRAINRARASARACGDRHMAAAPPLQWNLQLQWAATAHSRDMARQDYVEHRDPAGDSVRERVRLQTYPWRHVGENIAGGTDSLDRTVEVWLASPSHCENLMEPDYRDMALACAERAGTEYENYWTLVMARR